MNFATFIAMSAGATWFTWRQTKSLPAVLGVIAGAGWLFHKSLAKSFGGGGGSTGSTEGLVGALNKPVGMP